MNLFRIGEVSKACNLSIKTIRYYEEFGLISPIKVDIYTGYRYYDSQNIERLFQIQFLKGLGFTLQEIKDFDKNSIAEKCESVKNSISILTNNLKILNSLNNQKGEINMKPFINDENAVGKWNYVFSVENMIEYQNGNYYFDNDILLKELYFLPEGEDYWIFEGWTKGEIYHYSGVKYIYSIKDNKLFLEVYNEDNQYETMLVFEKVSNKKFSKKEISICDDVDIPFVQDENLVGVWNVIDYISISDIQNYIPKQSERNLFVQKFIVTKNGECIREDSQQNLLKQYWTKGYILNKHIKTASAYTIREIENEQYLFMEWKSGDYTFAGKVTGAYVFKKM